MRALKDLYQVLGGPKKITTSPSRTPTRSRVRMRRMLNRDPTF
jgi:hypothetical protein